MSLDSSVAGVGTARTIMSFTVVPTGIPAADLPGMIGASRSGILDMVLGDRQKKSPVMKMARVTQVS
jgi:hypothetical protein